MKGKPQHPTPAKAEAGQEKPFWIGCRMRREVAVHRLAQRLAVPVPLRQVEAKHMEPTYFCHRVRSISGLRVVQDVCPGAVLAHLPIYVAADFSATVQEHKQGFRDVVRSLAERSERHGGLLSKQGPKDIRNDGAAPKVADPLQPGGSEAGAVGPKPALPRRQDLLPALTGVRGVAACIVAVFHMNYWFYTGNWNADGPGIVLATVFRAGYLGVDLFFALSGYVIASAYLEAFRHPSPGAYAHFLIRRFARIWPLHVATLLLYVGAPACRAPGDLAGNLLMVQAWGIIGHITCNEPSWSISGEWFAYLAFPGLAWLLLRSGRWAALAMAALGLGGLGMLAWLGGSNSLNTTFSLGLARAACGFTIGAALCRGFADVKPHLAFDGCGILTIAAVGGLAMAGAPDLLVAGLFGPLVLCIALAAGPLRAILGAAPVVWLGEISYSLYLWHHFLIDHLKSLGAAVTTPAAVGLVLCLVIGVAALSRRWIEQPARIGIIALLSGLPRLFARPPVEPVPASRR